MRFKMEVGRLLLNRARDILKMTQFDHPSLRWVESSGWISRQILVEGGDEAVAVVRDRLSRLFGFTDG